jgi:hypothetical protein
MTMELLAVYDCFVIWIKATRKRWSTNLVSPNIMYYCLKMKELYPKR